MTRINLVHVQDLADQHAFAEWREIKMIPAKLKKLHQTTQTYKIMESVPPTYTMATGHVRFFYDKMYFLKERYIQLTEELRNRDFNLSIHDPDKLFFENIVVEMQDPFWEPSRAEVAINIERINLRISEKPNWYRFYGEVKSPEYFAALYNLQLDTFTT